MALYRKLLLSTGGGVTSNVDKDKQEACATIAIGLGGTGVDCLRTLKRRVYESIEPDVPDALTPSYSHIKFLAVDSDKKSLAADEKLHSLDVDTEFFDISNTNIQKLLQNAQTYASKPEEEWLTTANEETGAPGISILSASAGAGGVRQIGRLLLVEKADAFVSRVKSLIAAAKTTKAHEINPDFNGASPLNIHIFTGMGGGTGSGTFLDVCYLVQRAIQETGVTNVTTMGYFFLPDVNLCRPMIYGNEAISTYIKVNGLSAMKELNYCMDFESNGGAWDQQYHGFHIGPLHKPPVMISHLISSRSTDGTDYGENGYFYALNVVCDFVMQFMVRNDVSMESHISNYNTAMGKVKKKAGANNNYCLLGASNAVIPRTEISTYLASVLFQKMSKLGEQIPTDQEILEFARTNGLTYEGLYQELLKGTSARHPSIPVEHTLFKDMGETDLAERDKLVIPETIGKPYDEMREKMVNQIAVNKKSLTHGWSWEGVDHDDDTSVSKVWKVYYELAKIVEDPGRGPQYAAVMLNGTGRKNLVSLLTGVQEQAAEAKNNIVKNQQLRIQEVKNARSAFLHPKLRDKFAAKRLFDDFIARLARYESDCSQIRALEELDRMLTTMRTQLTDLYHKCFEIYMNVCGDLSETFQANYKTLTDPERKKMVEDPFIIPLMTINDLKEALDASVQAMRLEDETRAFHQALFANHACWASGTEDEISRFVSDYLVGKFSGYTQKTLTGYLQLKFGDDGDLVNKVYSNIIKPLSEKAQALFSCSSPDSVANASPIGYCCVPDSSTEIQAAAAKLPEDPSANYFKVVKIALSDRIFLMRCICGVSMYQYSDIGIYTDAYKHDVSVGKHLYEGAGKDPRNWKLLRDIRPFSTLDSRQASETQRAEANRYEIAVERKVIVRDRDIKGVSQLRIMPDVSELLEVAKKAVVSQNSEEIEAAQNEIKTYQATAQPKRVRSLRDDGMEGHEDDVRRDYVLLSRSLMELVEEELKKKEDLDQALEDLDFALSKLQKAAEDKVDTDQKRSDFFDIILTGVVDTSSKIKVTYTRKKRGMVVGTTDLSLPTAQFPYGKIPLYQAFVTYCELPDEVRNEMREKAQDAMLNGSQEELEAVVENLDRIYTDDFLGAMQKTVVNLPGITGNQIDEITNFLLQFMDAKDNFRMMYL